MLENEKYFADNNCAQISHVISHEFLRRNDNKRKVYFDGIHKFGAFISKTMFHFYIIIDILKGYQQMVNTDIVTIDCI